MIEIETKNLIGRTNITTTLGTVEKKYVEDAAGNMVPEYLTDRVEYYLKDKPSTKICTIRIVENYTIELIVEVDRFTRRFALIKEAIESFRSKYVNYGCVKFLHVDVERGDKLNDLLPKIGFERYTHHRKKKQSYMIENLNCHRLF